MSDYEGVEKFITETLKEKLPKNLSYHSFYHVMDVLNAALRIAENEKINGEDLKILRIGVLFHDSGFINTTINHEIEGCEIARHELPEYGFSLGQIERVCGMILATKIPQSPKNQLEKIICDADLDYLGRDDFYAVGNKLYEEMKSYDKVKDEKHWNMIQRDFLKVHYYHTDWSHKHRALRKQEHLNEIIRLVESY
ncbi:MAG: HD domain-containing protein [Bacteroidia bacterium]